MQLAERARARHGLPTKTEAAGRPAPLTFDAFAKRYERDIIPTHRGQARELEILPTLRAAFGPMPLESLTRAKVQAWMTARLGQKRRGRLVTANTVNREIDLLKSMLRTAVEWHLLEASPIIGMKRLHVTKRPRSRLTIDDEDRLLEAIDDPRDRAMLIMGLDTLARMGDILDFRRDHDHGKTLTIVDPKNGELLEVPVSRRLRAALKAVPMTTSPYYFAHRRVAKNPRDWRSSVRQMLEAACKRADIDYGRANNAITWHGATRRTGASRMLARKVPITAVMQLGGWKTLEQVKDYQVPEDAVLRNAVEAVGRRRKRA